MATTIKETGYRDYNLGSDGSKTGAAAVAIAQEVCLRMGTSAPYTYVSLKDLYIYAADPVTKRKKRQKVDAYLNAGGTLSAVIKALGKGNLSKDIAGSDVVDKKLEPIVKIKQAIIFEKQPNTTSLNFLHTATPSAKPDADTKFFNDPNEYVMIDLGGDSPIKYVKKNEIRCEGSDLLSIFEGATDLTFAEAMSKLNGKTWTYNGQEIKTIYLAQFEKGRQVAKEEIDSDLVVRTNPSTGYVDEYGNARTAGTKYESNSSVKIPNTFSRIEICTMPESTADGVVNKPKVKSLNYVASATGNYMKVRLYGNKASTFIKLDAETLKGVDPSTFTPGMVLTLSIEGEGETRQDVSTEPLTLEEITVRYAEDKVFQRSNEAMSADSYLRLKNGTMVNEERTIQPRAYKKRTAVGPVATDDMVAVQDTDGKFYIMSVADLRTGFKLADGMVINSETDARVTVLDRCEFNSAADFVQTKTDGKKFNPLTQIRKTSSVETTADLESSRQEFLTEYNNNNYILDVVYVNGSPEKLDGNGRYSYTNEIYQDYNVSSSAEFKEIQSQKIKYEYNPQTGKFQRNIGKKGQTWSEMCEKHFKLYGKILGVGLLALGGPMLLLAMAPAMLGTAAFASAFYIGAAVVAALPAVAIPVGNAVRRVWSLIKTLPDQFKQHQQEVDNNLQDKYQEFYKDLTKLSAAELTDEMIVGKIARMSADVHVFTSAEYNNKCEMDANGNVIVTPQNAGRAQEMKREIDAVTQRQLPQPFKWLRLTRPVNAIFGTKLGKYNKELAKTKDKLLKLYNKLFSPPLTEFEEAAIQAKSTDTRKVRLIKFIGFKYSMAELWKKYTDLSIKIQDINKEVEDIKTKYANVDDSANKELEKKWMQKTENMKAYLCIRRELLSAGKSEADIDNNIALDMKTGRIFVGNQELIKVGDEYQLVPLSLSKKEKKALGDEARQVIGKTFNIPGISLDNIKDFAKTSTTMKTVENIEADTSKNKPITAVELDIDTIKAEVKKVETYIEVINYIHESIINNNKMGVTIENFRDLEAKTDNILNIISKFTMYQQQYKTQEEYLKTLGADIEPLFTTRMNAVDADDIKNKLVACDKFCSKEEKVIQKAEINNNINIVERYIKRLKDAVKAANNGTLDAFKTANPDIAKDIDTKTINDVAVTEAIRKVNDFAGKYDAEYKGLKGFDASNVRAKAVLKFDYTETFKSLPEKNAAKLKVDEIKEVYDRVNKYVLTIDKILLNSGTLTPEEMIVKTDLENGVINTLMQADIRKLTDYYDLEYLSNKTMYDSYGYATFFNDVKRVKDKSAEFSTNSSTHKNNIKAEKEKVLESHILEVRKINGELNTIKAELTKLSKKKFLTGEEIVVWEDKKKRVDELKALYVSEKTILDASAERLADIYSVVNEYTVLEKSVNAVISKGYTSINEELTNAEKLITELEDIAEEINTLKDVITASDFVSKPKEERAAAKSEYSKLKTKASKKIDEIKKLAIFKFTEENVGTDKFNDAETYKDLYNNALRNIVTYGQAIEAVINIKDATKFNAEQNVLKSLDEDKKFEEELLARGYTKEELGVIKALLEACEPESKCLTKLKSDEVKDIYKKYEAKGITLQEITLKRISEIMKDALEINTTLHAK